MPAMRSIVLASLVLTTAVACDKQAAAEAESNAALLGEYERKLKELEQRADDLSKTAAKAEANDKALAEAKAQVEELEAKVEELEGAKGSLEGELEQKQAALEAVKTLQDALAKSLVEEIETGDIRVSQRDGLLVVDVSDKVLFAVGEAELSERGQQVLTTLADSLKALPKQAVFQVGGHTDNQPIKSDEVKAKFPTNWELSAARATNVVRFLEETCKIPGKRLVAAGFSEFRPVAGNKKPGDRAKNRRIEIALLPQRK
jgi:chemotaxis protein MotB